MLPMSCVTRVGAVDLQRIEHAGDVAGLGLLVEAAGGLGGEAHAAQVRHDHGVVARQVGRQRRPHVAGLAIAVQQDYRRPGAAEAHMNGVPLVAISVVGIPAESRRRSCSNIPNPGRPHFRAPKPISGFPEIGNL